MTIAPLLTTLPPEILLIFSEHMVAHELVRLSRTCRTLRHFGGCKSVAKAFTRRKSADDAIEYLRDKVNRLDLVIELFRRAKYSRFAYSEVSIIAARLNDRKQLLAWQAEFGEIPSRAIIGAAQSDRIETFEFIYPHVKIDDDTVNEVFENIGVNEKIEEITLLDYLRTKYPDFVTPKRLECVVQNFARNGRFGSALEIFEGMSPRCGEVIIACAGHIADGAALHGDMDLFTEFIDMFEYDDERRNEIAASAAYEGRLEFILLQEESRNAAVSFGVALQDAVDSNFLDVFQYLLASDDFVSNRFETGSILVVLRSAIRYDRLEMMPLLLARVPRISLLREAAQSKSLDKAKMLLVGFDISELARAEDVFLEVGFGAYTAHVPDWKMTVWLVIIGVDSDARKEKSNIVDAERARYQSVLPPAIDLARELDISHSSIDKMVRFVRNE